MSTNNKYATEFNDRLRFEIRYRDGLRCFLCGEPVLLQNLHVHHIDYNKMNPSDANMISLCSRCHAKTNFNRCFWTIFFQNLIVGRLTSSFDSYIDDDYMYVFED